MPAGVWPRIAGLIPVRRRSKWPLAEVVDAILYMLKNNCGWRDIPGEFPCGNTALRSGVRRESKKVLTPVYWLDLFPNKKWLKLLADFDN